jgi:hypothetical protein
MVKGEAHRQLGETSDKWLVLAERRCEFFAELWRSGRWKLYCNEEEQFALRMQEVMGIAARWRKIAASAEKAGGEAHGTAAEAYQTAA